jgi:subtilisin family serine protease
VGIRSSSLGTGYRLNSGTSMAGPHVAGTLALIWSAAPTLIGDVDASEQMVSRAARARTTTQACGSDEAGDVPNNVYGWGIIDALAGVERAWLPISNQGFVLGGFPLSNVRYALAVTNTAPLTLTDVTLMDTLPLSTSLDWADDGYQLSGRTVSWSVPVLPPEGVLSRTLEVALDDVVSGSVIVNDQYGLTANELSSTVMGMPIEVFVPWRTLLFPILKDGHMGGGSDG